MPSQRHRFAVSGRRIGGLVHQANAWPLQAWALLCTHTVKAGLAGGAGISEEYFVVRGEQGSGAWLPLRRVDIVGGFDGVAEPRECGNGEARLCAGARHVGNPWWGYGRAASGAPDSSRLIGEIVSALDEDDIADCPHANSRASHRE